MSKREELIGKLEAALNEKQQIAKRFQLTSTEYEPAFPDPNRQLKYEQNIREMEQADKAVFDLVQLLKELPKEVTLQVKQKRDQLVNTIQNEAQQLHNLNQQRQGADSDMMRRVLDNQISDLGGSLDAHKKLLLAL